MPSIKQSNTNFPAANLSILHFFPHGAKEKLFKKESTMLFSEWFETWLGEKSLRLQHGKGMGNSAYNQTSFGPALGHLPLSQITDSTVAEFSKIPREKRPRRKQHQRQDYKSSLYVTSHGLPEGDNQYLSMQGPKAIDRAAGRDLTRFPLTELPTLS